MKNDNNYSFVAYIDESGCDGFDKKHNGSHTSKWFVLSALVVRKSLDVELPRRRDKILQSISQQRKIIHMRKINNHEHKLYIAKETSNIPARYLNILSNKYSVLNSERKDLFDKKNTYYNYMARYLIERISWCCNYLRPKVPEGNGKVKIFFSMRGGMSYTDFQTYLKKLKDENKDSRINWNVIDIDLIEAQPHSKRAGLQLVDVIAYSFFKAVEQNELNMVDTSYAQKLTKPLFKHKGKIVGYGLKFVPKLENLPEEEKPKELLDILN